MPESVRYRGVRRWLGPATVKDVVTAGVEDAPGRELPQPLVYVGGAIVAGAGLFVIWRESRLGMKRPRASGGWRRPEI